MKKLLVRATNWLGDAVMSLPALREIRRAHEGWRIAVLARPWIADLYAREDICDRIVVYENRGRHKGLKGKRRLARELRAEKFDRAILLQNAFDAALLAWAARIPERIGYARDGRGLLLTNGIPVADRGGAPAHQRFYYLDLVRRAGSPAAVSACGDIRLDGAEAAAAAGRERWRRRGLPVAPWIGVSPGAAYGGAKRWLPERFAAAARELAGELDAQVAVFGSPAETTAARSIASAVGKRGHCLAGETSLAEFIELVASCRLYLANDSGPMHVAAALGVPTVAVFGATDPTATGPSASWAKVIREPVACAPCFLRECPIVEPIAHPCMRGVEAARVIAAARSLLSVRRPSSAV